MFSDSIPAIAHVECRSEGREEEYPTAIIWGGNRFEIVEILDCAVITSVVAGGPVRNRYWVVLEDDRRCQLIREMPDGEWRVTFGR